MNTVAVMTYNIWRGGRGGVFLDQAVRTAAPDVLLVNETPKTPVLWRHRCVRLANRWDMAYIAGGRSAGSNMILTRPGIGVESTHVRVLPQPPGQPRRGVAAAQLIVDHAPLGVVSCHLSLDQERRLGEIESVIEGAGFLRGTVVVAGDLNERPTGPCWQRLRDEDFVDHGTSHWLTFPASEPRKRIDALLMRGGAEMLHHGDPGIDEALQKRASDHRAVLAVLEL